MRFLFDSAVVGVRPRMSAARKRRCGGRAVYCGKNERIRTGKNTCGGKIRAAGGAAGRAEDASGKRVSYFYRQIRGRIYAARAYENRAERENKEPCARRGRKDRKEVLRADKNGCGKSKPRVRKKRAHGRERRIVGKQVKMNCFCGFFIQTRKIKAKKVRRTG